MERSGGEGKSGVAAIIVRGGERTRYLFDEGNIEERQLGGKGSDK